MALETKEVQVETVPLGGWMGQQCSWEMEKDRKRGHSGG